MKCSSLFSQIRLIVLSVMLASSVTACMKPSARSADPNADFSNDKAQAAATFFNGDVTGSGSVSKNLEGFSIPTQKLFNFSTCVKDKRTQETIKGHKFSITGAPGAVVVANGGRSDESGCVNWSETLDYNGLADAKYLPIKRTIVANGMHTGARELQICINPWADGAEAVKDCGRKAVPEEQIVKVENIPTALKGETSSGNKNQSHLWIDDMRINAAHSPGGSDGALIDLSVSMAPKILTKNIRGESTPLVLNDGAFSVQFWIIAKTGGSDAGKCLVIAKSQPSVEMAMVGGRLRNELNMRIRYMSTYGQLELVGAITPKNSSIAVGPYNGVWMLGDHTALLGMKFAFERKEAYSGAVGSFSAKKYAENCTDVSTDNLVETPPAPVKIVPLTAGQKAAAAAVVGKYKNGPAGQMPLSQFAEDADGLIATIPPDLNVYECVRAEDIPRLFPLDEVAQKFKPGNDVITCANENLPSAVNKIDQFEFDVVAVRAEPIADPIHGETTTERTVKYVVTTTVRNPLTQGSPLRDIVFNVKKSDGSVEPVRTNPQGQFIFNDEIKHVYFHPERYMLKVVEITQASGFKKRLPIVLNPWDNNGFTFGRDIRMLKKQIIAQVNLIPRPKSELLLTQFQWGTQGFNYKVDNSLNLAMYKDFNLTISPRVLRYSSLTEGRMKNEALRDGIYVMKVAIQKDYKPLNDGPQEYITAVTKLVRVANGIINTPVTMEFRDFRVLKIRSNMMIEIQAINESKLSQKQRKELQFDGPADSLVESNSGLAARTFVGPVVAYSNGFSASMRPTDDLAEAICSTIDCDEVKRDESRQTAKILCAHAKDGDDVCSLHKFKANELREIVVKRCIYSNDNDPACSQMHTSADKRCTDKFEVEDKNASCEKTKFTAYEEKEIRIERKAAGLFDSYNGYPKVWRQQSEILVKNSQKLAAANVKERAEAAKEREKYRGSIAHLANKTVGDMLLRQAKLKVLNENKTRESANLARVLSLGNFEYGALANESGIATPGSMIAKNNAVLPSGSSFLSLVQRLSSYDPHDRFYDSGMERVYRQMAPSPILELGEFRKTLFEAGNLNTDQAMRLCVFFIEDMILRRNEKTETSLGFSDRKQGAFTRKRLNEACVKEVLGTTGSKPSVAMGQIFSVEHMLRVFKVGDSEPTGGNLMNLSVGAGHSFSQGASESFSYSWTPLGILKVIPGVKDVYDALGWSASKSWSDSTAMSEGGSTGSNTSLAVEVTGMSLKIDEHERCTAIRLSQPFLAKIHADLDMAISKTMSNLERGNRVSRGLFLCEGVLRRAPTFVDERFYQFSQGIGEEVANDPVAIENHPYLKSIRGRTNYIEFVTSITDKPAKISLIPMHVSIGEFSVEQLTKVFNSPTQNLPGVLRLDRGMIQQLKTSAK